MYQTPNIILFFFIGNLTCKYLLNSIFNVELKKQYLYISLYMTLFITYYLKPVNYDFNYIISNDNENYDYIQLKACLVIYLYEDLIFDKFLDNSMIFHHIECIIGLICSLQTGLGSGLVNNSLSNEISTIFLMIFNIVKKEKNKNLRIIKNISFILFYINFILYRLILLTKLNYIIFYENITIFRNMYPIYSLFLFCNSFSHLLLQYYWFVKINITVYKELFNKTIKNKKIYN